MTTLQKTFLYAAIVAIFAAFAINLHAQEEMIKPLSAELQAKILKAQRDRSTAQANEAAMDAQYAAYKKNFADVEAKAQASVIEAEEEAWKASGLEKSKYTFDDNLLTFTPKTVAAKK